MGTPGKAGAAAAALDIDGQAPKAKLQREIELLCQKSHIPKTPLLRVRIDDLAGLYAVVQFLETKVWQDNGPTGAPEEERKLSSQLALIEALGKARERFRKAMREFQEDFVRTASPVELGLADLMKPLLKKSEGVLEDALEYERKKKQRPARAESEDPEE